MGIVRNFRPEEIDFDFQASMENWKTLLSQCDSTISKEQRQRAIMWLEELKPRPLGEVLATFSQDVPFLSPALTWEIICLGVTGVKKEESV